MPCAGIQAAEPKDFSSCEVAYALCMFVLQVQMHSGAVQAAKDFKCLHKSMSPVVQARSSHTSLSISV